MRETRMKSGSLLVLLTVLASVCLLGACGKPANDDDREPVAKESAWDEMNWDENNWE